MLARTLAIILISLPALTLAENKLDTISKQNIDSFTKLRWDTFNTPGYNNDWTSSDERDALFTLHGDRKYDQFLEQSAKWLEKHPIDIQVIYVRTFTHLRQGNHKEYAKGFATYTSLIASIMSSGDGKTKDTAFKVVTVKEEYAVLNELGLDLIKQSLVKDAKGNPCDAMLCKDRNDKQTTIYFNVSAPFKQYNKTLTPKDEDKNNDEPE